MCLSLQDPASTLNVKNVKKQVLSMEKPRVDKALGEQGAAGVMPLLRRRESCMA